MIKISVIIPCYNVEKYIDECLDSIFRQTIGIENLQVILIDDALTDGTLEHLMKYEQQYCENILLYVLEENQGQANARNIGIENAIGEYIAFVDADDWIELDMYESLYQMAVQTKADLI